MAVVLSYIQETGKLLATGLTISNTYKITKFGDSSPSAYTGITGVTFYSEYFLKAGTNYTITITDQANVSSQAVFYADYDDSFLINSGTRKNQQISIVFDETIGSFRPVRKDSLIETIGSKYPFIIRNAAVNYKTMEFSGNITCHMDLENFSGYGLNKYYSDYNSAVYIERNFRDWFEEWINDGYPKVLKTPMEGIRIVRIHNVSFTPIKSLGRLIYNFSCTITEIADYSLANLIKYGFISATQTTAINYLYPELDLYPSTILFPSGA